MKQTAALLVVCAAVGLTAAQYATQPTKGKKHRTTTTTTESTLPVGNEISVPFPFPDAEPSGASSGATSFSSSSASSGGHNLPGSGAVTSGGYWWAGPDSPFKPGSQPGQPAGGCGGGYGPGGCGPAPPPPPPPPSTGGCGGPAGCTGLGTDPRPSPVQPPSKPVDIENNPFLSSAIYGKPIPSGPQGCQGGSGGACGYPGIGPTPGTYPGAPPSSSQYPGSKPTGQYPGQPAGTGPTQYPGSGPTQYPGGPGSPSKPTGQYPGQPGTGPSQYPGQPSGTGPSQQPGPIGQPSGQYPGQPSGQYPGQPSGQPSGQYPGQPSGQPSGQYHGQPSGQPSGQYPGQPSGQPSGQPTGQPSGQPSGQYPGQPSGQHSGQYPGQPSGQYPGQPSGQYPGKPSGQYPGQPSGQYPGQPAGQYPGQPQYPGGSTPNKPSGQYPGQPSGTGPTQYPGAPTGQYPEDNLIYPEQKHQPGPGGEFPRPQPGAPNVPLRPQCSAAGHACVPAQMCVGGVITSNGMNQIRDPKIKECIPGHEVCCRIPPKTPFPGSGPAPGYGGPTTTQRPYTGPLNTTPYPGCAAALKCVPESYCTADGVMSDSPVTLTREQQANKVPLSECLNMETGIIGKCCKDPNYSDPWPAGMMMGAAMLKPGDFDDGQYHGEGSGPTISVGPSYNSISSTPQTPSKDHGPKPSDRPGGFNKPFPPPFPGNTPSGSPYSPGKPQPSGTPYQPGVNSYQPGQPKPSGTPYQPTPGSYQPGKPSGTPYQPGQPSPTGSYQPGQPSPTGTYQPGQPSPTGTYQPGQPSPTGSYQPGQPSPTGTYQPGQPSPAGTYQPGQPSPTGSYQPGQPSPTGTYQPGQPSPTGTYQPGQPSPTGSYQPGQPSPTGTYQPGQPSPTGTYQPGQPSPTGSYQPGQPRPTGTYQPGQPSPTGTYQPGQPTPTGTYQPGQPSPPGSFQPGQPSATGTSYQPGQPSPTGNFVPEQSPDQPRPSIPTHPGHQDQGPAPGSSCGIRRPGPDGDVAGFGEFPWQALVMSAGNRTLLCGAALISETAVITAAHCVDSLRSRDLLVKAGEGRLLAQNPKPVQVRPVGAISWHPSYDSASRAYDLAILTVSEPFALDTHVDKICVPPTQGSNYLPTPGQQCLITGWGKLALLGPVQGSEMHKVDASVLPANTCEAQLKSTSLGKYFILNEGFSCAVPPKPSDLCKVDTGSAVACVRPDGHYELAGVNSWDIPCPVPEPRPSVFTTSDATWINTVLDTPLPVLQAEEEDHVQSLSQGEDVEGVDIDDKPGFSQGYGK